MLCVASHRLLHFIDRVETNGRSPSEFDADLIIDLCKSGCIVPQRDAVKDDSAIGGAVILLSGGERTMLLVALPKPREAVWNAGDNDGRVRFSRLCVVCNIQWAVTVLLHVKLCSSFCQHALWNSARCLCTDAKSSSTRVEKVHPSLILFGKSAVEICTDTMITS